MAEILTTRGDSGNVEQLACEACNLCSKPFYQSSDKHYAGGQFITSDISRSSAADNTTTTIYATSTSTTSNAATNATAAISSTTAATTTTTTATRSASLQPKSSN